MIFEKEITLSYYFCLEGNLCSVCVVKLCEEGSAGTCPILAIVHTPPPENHFFIYGHPPVSFINGQRSLVHLVCV